ncbi:MAG: hypothetical protein RL018_1409 [Pseudomonadota bacterium]|jgi:acetyl esterase/lipase
MALLESIFLSLVNFDAMKKSNLKYCIFLASAILLTACLRLDSNVFNKLETTSYGLDSYTGEREISDLPNTYSVEDSKIHLFTLESNDDGNKAKIYAIYLGDIDSIATDTVIMYCHGNKFHMDLYWNRAKLLAHVGGTHHYGVLMIDYRGYGMSEGTPTESGIYADVDAALSWLKSKGLSNDRLVMYGFSLGSAPATELTAHPRSMTPMKLILESPFASSEVMVQDASALALPGSYFTNVKIDNEEEIKLVHQPFCWLHGINDDFLSIETHGEPVFRNHPGPIKEAHRVVGGVHNDVPRALGYAEYARTIDSFIK